MWFQSNSNWLFKEPSAIWTQWRKISLWFMKLWIKAAILFKATQTVTTWRYRMEHLDVIVQDTLRIHKELRHDSHEVYCKLCRLKTTSFDVLNEHKPHVHLPVKYPCAMYQCDLCGYSFKIRGKPTVHKLSKHEHMKYPCNICEFIANTPRQITGSYKDETWWETTVLSVVMMQHILVIWRRTKDQAWKYKRVYL